jgi:sialidase-1
MHVKKPISCPPVILLFSNPASETERIELTVRVSYDEGKTWAVAKLLNAGPSGSSCLTELLSPGDHQISPQAGRCHRCRPIDPSV